MQLKSSYQRCSNVVKYHTASTLDYVINELLCMFVLLETVSHAKYALKSA